MYRKMHQTCKSLGYVSSRIFSNRGIYESSTRLSTPVTAVGTREEVKHDNEPVLSK